MVTDRGNWRRLGFTRGGAARRGIRWDQRVRRHRVAADEVALTRSAPWEQLTDKPLLVLVFAFLVAYAAPIITPGICPGWRILLEWIEIGTRAAESALDTRSLTSLG